MNNARIIMEDVNTETEVQSVAYREKVEYLTELIEALQSIAGSSYWKVLQNYVFDVELAKSKRRLEIESDTTEIFRLQGEARLGKKYDLEKLLAKYREELIAVRKKI